MICASPVLSPEEKAWQLENPGSSAYFSLSHRTIYFGIERRDYGLNMSLKMYQCFLPLFLQLSYYKIMGYVESNQGLDILPKTGCSLSPLIKGICCLKK